MRRTREQNTPRRGLGHGLGPPGAVVLEQAALDVDTPEGGRRRILHPVSLRLTEQVVAVVGANGSGKSTLLRMIAGLVEPSEGAVHFESTAHPVHSVHSGGTSGPAGGGRLPSRPRCGFIFANPQAQIIMPVVGEDIEFSLRGTITDRRSRSRRAREILASLDLEHRADSSVYELSSGERQKVALAGVLATEPELVVADEPTTLLDLRNAAEFQRRLLSLPQADPPVPLILATHDLGFAARADRVLVFDDGRMVDDSAEDGSPETAISRYRRLALG